MENLCHRCGAPVAEEAQFCSHCGAPQIRVNTNTEEEVPLPEAPSYAAPIPPLRAPAASLDPRRLNWGYALPSAAKAGLAMSLASLIPVLNSFFPIWMLIGGWFAVSLYLKRSLRREVSASDGAKLGAVAGLLGFAFFAALFAILISFQTFVLHQGSEFRALLRSILEQAASKNPDPKMQQMIQWAQTPEGLALVVIASMVVFLLAFLIFASVGGTFRAAVAKRRNP